MKKSPPSFADFSKFGKAQPLTLEQVLRLRDGLKIARGEIPRVPVRVRPDFNRAEWTMACQN